MLANLRLLGFTFFLLEQKEPKIQDKPDRSARFVGPLPTVVATLQVVLYNWSKILSIEVVYKALKGRIRKVITIKVAIQARWAECRPEAIRHS